MAVRAAGPRPAPRSGRGAIAAGLAVLGHARPVRGSWTVVWLRTAVVIVATAPGWIAAWRAVGDGPGRRPYYTDVATGPPPLAHFLGLARELSEPLLPALAGGAALAVLLSLVLTGGALAALSPGRPDRPARVGALVAEVWSEGWDHLPAFLRVLLCEVLIAGAGLWGLAEAFERLAIHGKRALWTGYAVEVLLPFGRVGLSALLIASVGAWGLHTRAGLVAGDRRAVLREGLRTVRRFCRRPLSGPVLYAATTLSAMCLSGWVLVSWRQAPPASPTGAWLRLLVWTGVLLLLSWLWHWLVRVAASAADADDPTASAAAATTATSAAAPAAPDR